MTIEMIDPEKVKDNPFQPRSSYPVNKIAEIAYSIEQIGLIHTPKGRRVNGHVELAEGHLRKRAFIKLKKKNPKKFPSMPVDIAEIPDRDMAIIALEENLRRQDITPLDQARAIDKYLTTFDDITETALAKTLNMTQGNISNMRRVLKCPDEVLQKIVDGRINFTMARELLVFHGKKAEGSDRVYNRKDSGYVDVPKDDKWLMLTAVRKIGQMYGCPATVDGMKKAIYETCESYLHHLEKGGYMGHRDPLFDTRTAGCLKCKDMIRANETKSRVKHFCTNPECWDKKQADHKAEQAKAAKKKMEADIAKRIAETEAHNALVENVTGKTPDVPEMPEDSTIGIPLLDTAEEVLEDQGIISQEIPAFATFEEVCKGCIQQKGCDRTSVHVEDEGGRYLCADRVTKENYQAVRDKAKIDMPDSFKKLVKDKAGTRAIVLDLIELRRGYYSDELKAGHALLDGRFYEPGPGLYGGGYVKTLEAIEDPEECTERCTEGFHYAYDSEKMDGQIHLVCSKPNCLSKKKGAFTRAKNAAGAAKKRAEMKAIKQAVEETEILDKPRLLLIIEAQLQGNHISRGMNSDHVEWLAKHLKIEKAGIGESKLILILKKLPGLSEDELRKLVVEFCLITLCYEGDVKGYKVQTTEKLNRMGIGVQVNKPEAKKS